MFWFYVGFAYCRVRFTLPLFILTGINIEINFNSYL